MAADHAQRHCGVHRLGSLGDAATRVDIDGCVCLAVVDGPHQARLTRGKDQGRLVESAVLTLPWCMLTAGEQRQTLRWDGTLWLIERIRSCGGVRMVELVRYPEDCGKAGGAKTPSTGTNNPGS